ncbi:hypothetical protein EGW08_007344 [Elysia chlorotica]|uniref:Testicular haploid expressed gene protein-like n=1 Tax=Elysia chlorotica TaxID=188477 RepID=A0A433TTI7_ELYCH|nr:hypothetical protein EGW08_007344 [Elysia chlorotica]
MGKSATRSNSAAGPINSEYDRIRTRGRPEQSWGTQETMWPLSRATQSATASTRVGALAQPKRNFQTGVHLNRPLWQYSCGRTSALSLVDANAMQGAASDRVQQLAVAKTYPQHLPNRYEFMYSCGRVSPIWDVSACSPAAPSEPRPRTVDLSVHKRPHPLFQPERSVPWEVSTSAKTHRPSGRTQDLSTPKLRAEGLFREPQWPVPETALNAVASPRCTELARAKSLADGFQHAREIQWPVSKAARRATASGRLNDLATPIQRVNMNVLQFNPDAFQVKPLALKAQLSSRVAELATPINR